MSKIEKLLLVVFPFISMIPTAHAGTIWPFGYFFLLECRNISLLLCIIIGFIVGVGFVKYFTKVSYQKAIWVSVCINFASGIFGIVLAVITYISMCIILYIVDDKGFWFIVRIFNIKVNTDTGEALFFMALVILAIIFAIFVNPLVEGFILKLMLKLKIKKTYKWLLSANALSVAICILLIFVMN